MKGLDHHIGPDTFHFAGVNLHIDIIVHHIIIKKRTLRVNSDHLDFGILLLEERLEGTIASNIVAVLKGASIVRVHDVKENIRAIKIAEAIMGASI